MGKLSDWFCQTDAKKKKLGKYKEFIHGVEKIFWWEFGWVGGLDEYSIGYSYMLSDNWFQNVT